ncbi:unnamed protein product, partial [Rotaria sp. Silwood1]
ERVKLRRTKPIQSTTTTTTITEEIKPRKINKISLKKPKISSINKNKKSFLGSGLDLDNILLVNRQRRCVQT